ncbi:MAG TPA: hypothetical protein VE155_08565 [Pseudonocardiaceae bacterium]|nr:hypothetical protein [Pseudonocardiaceae bacterium]
MGLAVAMSLSRQKLVTYTSATGSGSTKEVTDHGSHALMTGVRAIDHVGQIEQDAVRLRRGTENGAQQVPSAASDVGDRPQPAGLWTTAFGGKLG